MSWSCRIGRRLWPGVWVALLLGPAVLPAAERTKDKPLPKGEVVDVFSGIENGQLEVQLIPKDSSKCRLLVKNKTDKPLNVMLPRAFAGVPVLAQFPPIPNQNPNPNRIPQAVGIGPGRGLRNNGIFGPGLMRPGMLNLPGANLPGANLPGANLQGPNVPGGPFFPGPLFNVAPEKVGKLALPSVCLDYGRPDPRPRIKYQIKPIRSYTDKPGVAEICAMLGSGEISQRVAQLAAWHLNNDQGWKQLASLRQKAALGTQPSYSRKELQAAKKAAEEAVELAGQRRPPSGGEAESLSRK